MTAPVLEELEPTAGSAEHPGDRSRSGLGGGLTPHRLLLVAGGLPALAVYGLHWRRGHFLDDPLMDALSARELVATVGDLRARPLGTTLVGITYALGEASGRLLAAAILVATAALAGSLVRRVCGGRYAWVVVSLLVLYPLLDWESALYWYASIQYPAGTAFGLASAHTFLSTLGAGSRRSAIAGGALTAVLAGAALACTELGINFLLLLPVILVVEALRRGGIGRPLLARAVATMGAAVATVLVLGAFIYIPETDFTRSSGELLTHPVEAANRTLRFWLPTVADLTVSDVRLGIHGQALSLGIDRLREPAVAVVYLAAAVCAVVGIRRLLRAPDAPRRADDVRPSLAFAVLGMGVVVASLCLPAALLTGQFPVTRLLFAPWVAIALVVGAGVAALEAHGASRLVKEIVVWAVVAVVPLALTLDGYGALFVLRDDANRRQAAAWLEALEDAEPVPSDVRVVSLFGNDRLVGRPSPVDTSLAGITETPWALSRVLGDERRSPVQALGGHPFVPVCFARTDDPATVRVTTMFNDEVLPVASLLPAEVRDGRLAIVDGVDFGGASVDFPLAARVSDPRFRHFRMTGGGDRLCRIYGNPAP